MARWPKPSEGSWTEHFDLGTEPISYEDSISQEFYELEREAIYKRAWLNVGRVEQLARKGSYFTKELAVAQTSVVVVRGTDGEIRAFHNVCRHRGNKLVWNDYPQEETCGVARQFVCKYHGWRYDLDGSNTFVQQESEFFDFDRDDFGLVPVHCDVWAGFIFVNVAKGEPEQNLRDFLGPMVTRLENYPFEQLTERYFYRATVNSNWKLYMDAFQEFYHAPILHAKQTPPDLSTSMQQAGFEAPAYAIDGPHRLVSTAGVHPWTLPENMLKPMELITRSGLFGPWDKPDLDFDPEGGDQPRRLRPLGARLVPGLAQLRDPGLGPELVPHLPLLAHGGGLARLRGHAVLRAAKERTRARAAGTGGRLLQGVRAPGRQHARSNAAHARVTRDRPLPPDGSGSALPAPAQGDRGVGGRLQEDRESAEV